jgi:hypothetical protein
MRALCSLEREGGRKGEGADKRKETNTGERREMIIPYQI